MVKAALITPAYLSLAWALMVSYQIFTQAAVQTVVSYLVLYFPLMGNWLNLRIDMVVFVYAFAWVFVLSSIIPQLILGKEKSVLIQFIVCLALTLMAFVLVDVLKIYGLDFTNQAIILTNPYLQLFTNLLFAAFYLSLPYILMIAIDLRGRKAQKQRAEHVRKITDDYFRRSQGTDG